MVPLPVFSPIEILRPPSATAPVPMAILERFPTVVLSFGFWGLSISFLPAIAPSPIAMDCAVTASALFPIAIAPIGCSVLAFAPIEIPVPFESLFDPIATPFTKSVTVPGVLSAVFANTKLGIVAIPPIVSAKIRFLFTLFFIFSTSSLLKIQLLQAISCNIKILNIELFTPSDSNSIIKILIV